MVRVIKRVKFKLNKEDMRDKTSTERSNISLKGEHLRHRKPIKLPTVKFLERNKDEKPKSA